MFLKNVVHRITGFFYSGGNQPRIAEIDELKSGAGDLKERNDRLGIILKAYKLGLYETVHIIGHGKYGKRFVEMINK